MRIIVDTKLILPDPSGEYRQYLLEIFALLVKKNKHHEFVFLVDEPGRLAWAGKQVKSRAIASNSLLWKWWLSLRLPAMLKKHKADYLILAGGYSLLNVGTPQCLILPDYYFFYGSNRPKTALLKWYKRRLPQFLNKAETVCSLFHLTAKEVSAELNFPASKIVVLSPGILSGRLISASEREAVKNKYAEGKEFFFHDGSSTHHHQLRILLKAFSIFKKRQQTNFQLLVTGVVKGKQNQFLKSLGSYKYREDIILPGIIDQHEMEKILGAAYAWLDPFPNESFGRKTLQATGAGVPAILFKDAIQEELTMGAALWVNNSQPDEIAEQLMRIYKDEKKRNELIDAGKHSFIEYDSGKSAERLWECIASSIH